MKEHEKIYYIWDEDKRVLNIKKHHVDFTEAITVFNDSHDIFEFDEKHSESEDRYYVLGYSAQTRLLFVVFCEARSNTQFVIISARLATNDEKARYIYGYSSDKS
jgi:uncharacterized DUF497 family protein